MHLKMAFVLKKVQVAKGLGDRVMRTMSTIKSRHLKATPRVEVNQDRQCLGCLVKLHRGNEPQIGDSQRGFKQFGTHGLFSVDQNGQRLPTQISTEPEIEVRHTPKRGSWLNIAELEFAVLGRTVFKKRIADKEQLQRELDAICAHRSALAKPVQWQFNLPKARSKMAWVYPDLHQRELS
jgi:hypothetical protein